MSSTPPPGSPTPSDPSPAMVVGPSVPGVERVFTPEVRELLGDLHRRFEPRRQQLLAARLARQGRWDAGEPLAFPAATRSLRDDPDWRVAPAPADLADRRVEITGPTEPKMAINALNSGARVWLADLEDANTPHWPNVVEGQVVLADAARGTLTHTGPDGRTYALRDDAPLAVAVPRPRGWHLDEVHLTVDDAPMSGGLVDAVCYVAHNAAVLLERGSGPYLYLAKLESAEEAALWDDVLTALEEALGLGVGTIRVTVLIETLPAAFEMEEIVHALRAHLTGLNAGRWDYLFSLIKVLHSRGAQVVLPDRSQVTMTVPFMRAYSELLVRTCHKRGAHAIGGMSAFIPNRRDPAVTEQALAEVRADKQREADDGFDGSWVAHPDLVDICADVFGAAFEEGRVDQRHRTRDDVEVAADDLIALGVEGGTVTLDGVRTNVAVAVEYLAAWLGGRGAVAIANLMEDAATAEISRAQLWQWIDTATVTEDGSTVDEPLVRGMLDEEVARLVGLSPDEDSAARVHTAGRLIAEVTFSPDFAAFLTLSGYRTITTPVG